MPDLTPRQIQAMAKSLNLDVAAEDVEEVAHRINALLDVLGNLEHPDLDAVEAQSVFPPEDRGGDGR